MSLPYYPMYPRDFYEGTQRMSLELKGAYVMLLNLIYTQNGPVADEDGYLARYVGCSIRKWQKLRLELIGLGKITSINGLICNSRAADELLKRASYVDQKRENRARPNKNKALESQPRTTREKQEPEPHTSNATASEVPPTSRRRERAKVEPHFMADDWWPSQADFDWALQPENTKGIQLTIAEIESETHQCKRWFLDKRDAGDRIGKRPGHSRSWQTWICKSAPEIVRSRPRANGASGQRSGNGNGNGKPQSRFAPQISQHDAFALAAAQASGAECGGGWEPDYGHDPRPPVGPPRLEVIDSRDARGAGAGQPGGDRGYGSQTVLPLPIAAVR